MTKITKSLPIFNHLQSITRINVPSKVIIFSWRLLLEKLPTREALYHRGVIANIHETFCVFCFNLEETVQHMYLFGKLAKGKICKGVKHLIWLATTWCIWRLWNNILFRGDFVNVFFLVDQIMYISWFWFISRVRTKASLAFSDWCNNLLKCFQSPSSFTIVIFRLPKFQLCDFNPLSFTIVRF
jgi:hypothetical protein